MSFKILVVDDEADVRHLFSIVLQNAGHQVKAATNGLEALGLAQVEEFDAVVIDIAMPKLDGIAAVRALRETPFGRFVPVLVVTALVDEETRRQALDAGAVEVLGKPILPNVLVDVLNKYLPSFEL